MGFEQNPRGAPGLRWLFAWLPLVAYPICLPTTPSEPPRAKAWMDGTTAHGTTARPRQREQVRRALHRKCEEACTPQAASTAAAPRPGPASPGCHTALSTLSAALLLPITRCHAASLCASSATLGTSSSSPVQLWLRPRCPAGKHLPVVFLFPRLSGSLKKVVEFGFPPRQGEIQPSPKWGHCGGRATVSRTAEYLHKPEESPEFIGEGSNKQAMK